MLGCLCGHIKCFQSEVENIGLLNPLAFYYRANKSLHVVRRTSFSILLANWLNPWILLIKDRLTKGKKNFNYYTHMDISQREMRFKDMVKWLRLTYHLKLHKEKWFGGFWVREASYGKSKGGNVRSIRVS